MDEAKKQNWDPGVQGLVAFPEVLAFGCQSVNWTTQLGNAFLAQQEDVMQAVQRMRAKAEADGKLRSTPQETWRPRTRAVNRQLLLSRLTLMSGTCPTTIPIYLGSSGLGILSASRLSRDWFWLWFLSRIRSWPVFRRLGRMGLGWMGLVARLVRRRNHPQSFFLPSLWIPAFRWRWSLWAFCLGS